MVSLIACEGRKPFEREPRRGTDQPRLVSVHNSTRSLWSISRSGRTEWLSDGRSVCRSDGARVLRGSINHRPPDCGAREQNFSPGSYIHKYMAAFSALSRNEIVFEVLITTLRAEVLHLYTYDVPRTDDPLLSGTQFPIPHHD